MLKFLYNKKNKCLDINKNIVLKIKTKDFFPKSLGQKCGWASYMAGVATANEDSTLIKNWHANKKINSIL